MSPGISLELHWWRGIGPTVQCNLFYYGYRCGFFTVAICKHCVIDRYAVLRKVVEQSLDKSNDKRPS